MLSFRKDTDSLRPVLTVAELTGQIKDLLETSFNYIYVAGEVSNAKVYPSGHWYFSMKDDEATLPCVCFKNANKNIRFKLEDGLSVIARGKLSVYPPRGAYQLVVTSIEPVGIGEWQLAFEQLKARLQSEGLLAPERKRPIPIFPRKIGVVTSPVGAALRDILHTLARRNRAVDIVVSPARVQGEGSAESVADAIHLLSAINDLDVVIVARGGGSIEDLWSFNTEVVARAVAACKVPTISGVGHETDVTICDLVADLRAPTPTAAAEMVARGHQELLDRWALLTGSLTAGINDRLATERRRLSTASPQRSLLRYKDRLSHQLARVEHHRQTLLTRMEQTLSLFRHRTSGCRQRLEALGPQNVLMRGFAILRKLDGTLVTSFASVEPGERLEALLSKGKLMIEVKERQDEW